MLCFFCIAICTAFIFGTYAKAVDIAAPSPNANQPDAFTIEELNIISNYAILEGQTLQMQVEEFEEFVILSSVEWSSSRPDVISCTKNGEITGIKEGKATITVKAKIGEASDSITVYCVRKLNSPQFSRIKFPVALTYHTPNFMNILHIQAIHLYMFEGFPIFKTSKLEVKGVYDSYFYVEFERSEKEYKGFILQSWMPDNIATSEIFKQLSTYDLDVFVNLDKDQYKVTTNYKGTVEWKISDSSIIDFNETTGKVKGKAPGTATISATVGDKTLVCTIHSIYDWPLDWTGAARQETCVYDAKGNTYEETSDTLAVGDTFTVKGDMGSKSSWAYGVSESGTWGFIPISHLSNKGTISQYNSLGWTWPVSDVKNGVIQATKARYISSPYGWRDTDPARHKGVDITNGVSSNSDFANSVDGYEVVSAFAGKVIFVHDNSTGYKSCGNCVAIRSNAKDPITGKYYVAIYMHLKSAPIVGMYADISANQKIGYVGNTGNSGGSHLHFEVNNQNLSYGQKTYYENNSNKEMVFGSVINPLFFYMNYYNLSENDSGKIKINPTCDAMDYRKPLWYGDDIKESKKP